MAADDMPDASRPRSAPIDRSPADGLPERVRAWELVEPGRYRPRRIRGSFPGRELG